MTAGMSLDRIPQHPMTSLETPSSLAAGTVVTSDRLPWARVAASSFMAHHPGTRFVVLLVDEPDPRLLRDDDGFELRTLAQIGMDASERGWWALIYNGMETCCALKPWLLRYLLADAEAALWIDSDLLVCDSLREVANRAAAVGLVVSPHSLEPRHSDPRVPADDENCLLQMGLFNAGFLAVGRRGMPFLDWWAGKVARRCTAWASLPSHYYDQRWLDFVVNYFPCEVDRDPGANVARWNLYQRHLELVGDRYVVDGHPLRFFHFSGFDPGRPAVLCLQDQPHESTDVQRSAALARLVADYVRRLMSAGWTPRAGTPAIPKHAGIRLTPAVRAALRTVLIESDRLGIAPVAALSDPGTLWAWLRAPVSPSGAISWYLYGLWASQASLRATFPRVPGPDEHPYVTWSEGAGITLEFVPSVLAGPADTLNLDGARRFVALLDVGEVLDDPSLMVGLSDLFGARDEVTFLLRAPGWDREAVVRDLTDVLGEAGLDGPDSPDMLVLLSAAAPYAVAPLVHAVLTRRLQEAFVNVPHAPDPTSLRLIADTVLANDEIAA
jgi:hypothetical protein